MSDFVYDKDMLALLPPWYAAVTEYQAICQTEEAELDTLKTAVNAVYNNFFFQTMDEGAVAQWEAALNIAADVVNETLEFRRQRLVLRLLTRPPYSMPFLFSRLDELLGSGAWDAFAVGNTLYVQFIPASRSEGREITALIEKIKPAHVKYEYEAATTAELVICEEIYAIRTRHNYVLGAWGLGEEPFATPGARVLAKPAAETSLQPAARAAVAAELSTAITSCDYEWIAFSGGAGEDIIATGAVVAGGFLSFSSEIERENVQITKIRLINAGTAGIKEFFAMDLSVDVVQATSIVINIVVKEGGSPAWDA